MWWWMSYSTGVTNGTVTFLKGLLSAENKLLLLVSLRKQEKQPAACGMHTCVEYQESSSAVGLT